MSGRHEPPDSIAETDEAGGEEGAHHDARTLDAATLTFLPGYGDDDPGAHDVTVWDTQYGPVTDTWIYYQIDQPPLLPTPNPTATPAPTPHPTPAPTTPPAPTPPSSGQSSGGAGGSTGTGGGDVSTGSTAATGVSGGSGHAATLSAATTTVPPSGLSLWVLFLAGLAVLAAAGGVLAGRRLARR